MYAKNNASPERIAVGAVVLIADGTVQTSGVSVTVTPQGGASGAGGGTIAYEQGIVLYTPTQAETNYSSFIVTAYKASCIPVAATIVTSASATSGYAGLDWGVMANKTTTNALTGTTMAATQHVIVDSGTITTYTGNTPQTADVATLITTVGAAGAGLTALGDTRIANLDAAVSTRSIYAGGAVASVTAGVTVTTNNDKSGYSLTQTFPANFASTVISAAGVVSADAKKMNGTTVLGDGSAGNLWRG